MAVLLAFGVRIVLGAISALILLIDRWLTIRYNQKTDIFFLTAFWLSTMLRPLFLYANAEQFCGLLEAARYYRAWRRCARLLWSLATAGC